MEIYQWGGRGEQVRNEHVGEREREGGGFERLEVEKKGGGTEKVGLVGGGLAEDREKRR